MNLELDVDASFDAELPPLTSDMRRQIYELKAAYEEFWHQRKFRKGWAKPLFAFDEAVEELLDRAAEVVVRIRSHFDELSGSTSSAGSGLSKSTSSIATRKRLPLFKEGRAREYLSSLEQDPRAAQQQFVREIVHATLSNEDGYLEDGLTSDKLDRYIDKITLYMKQRDEQEARATVQLEEKLRRRWAKAEKLLQAFYALDTKEKTDKSYYQSLQKIIKRVDDVREELLLILRRKDAKQTQQNVDEAEVPSQAAAVDGEEQPTKEEEKRDAVNAAEAEAKSAEGEEPAEGKEREEEEEKEEEEEAVPAESQQSDVEAAKVEEKAEEPTQPPQQAVEQEVDESKFNRTEEGETSKASEAKPEETVAPVLEKEEEEREEKDEEKKEEESAQEEPQANAATPAAEGDTTTAGQVKEDEESEQRRRIEQEREKAMLKIKDVAHSVTRLSDQIEGFTSEATKLDMEALQKEPESAEKTLSKLQKQCLVYSENLMKDLLSLDAISTSTLPGSEQASEEVRPLRKQQVKEIQGLLQDVDQVNSKLKAMLKKVQEEKQRKEEQRKKFEMDERAKQPQPQQQQEEAAEKDRARSEGVSDQSAGGAKQPGSPKGSEMWRSMKLKPKFEMAQTHDATILQAHIPGMREEDIEIERDEDGQSFTVKGLRVPTPAEEAAMRRQLKSMLARDPWGLYYPQGEKERDLLMRMGAGRYGSFSETFEVSPDMDLSGISASYAGGVMRIVVPILRQKQQQPQPRQARAQPPYGAPQRHHRQPRGYGGYPQAAGGPQGFFNDKAFWW